MTCIEGGLCQETRTSAPSRDICLKRWAFPAGRLGAQEIGGYFSRCLAFALHLQRKVFVDRDWKRVACGTLFGLIVGSQPPPVPGRRLRTTVLDGLEKALDCKTLHIFCAHSVQACVVYPVLFCVGDPSPRGVSPTGPGGRFVVCRNESAPGPFQDASASGACPATPRRDRLEGPSDETCHTSETMHVRCR